MKTGPDSIRVRGAREHNLVSMDVDIPRGQLVVVTGVSGSGKSSLAFDTVFAEGQRKYMESLSAYARQFLDQLQKPDIESIEGLPPTIAIEQRSGSHTPRSTVATTTEIYDYLRLLLARCGQPTCWHTMPDGSACGQEITSSTPSQIVQMLLETFKDRRAMICGNVVRSKKGFHRDALEQIQRQGYVRARVNGRIVDLREVLSGDSENPLELGRYEMHDIEAVVDRIKITDRDRQRIAESIESALAIGDGSLLLLVEEGDEWIEHRFSERFSCPDHPACSIEELSPRFFSFNSPHGACRKCAGLGTVEEFDESLVVPDDSLGVGKGAVVPWRKNGRRMNTYYSRQLRKFCEAVGCTKETPLKKLGKRARRVLLHGTRDTDARHYDFKFEGVIPNLHRRYMTSESDLVKERMRSYMTSAPCPDCHGMRLRKESLHVLMKSGDRVANIADITSMTIEQADRFLQELTLDTAGASIAEPILKEIRSRLGFLVSVGLDYLSLDRRSSTLSGGEAQRIRLATQVGSGLVGVCYVLDEPTIGLHPRDNARLIGTLRHLSDIGNTVLVVEHDEEMIRAADHVIDIGPGPGLHGGRVVAQGTASEIARIGESVTGAFLSGNRSIEVPTDRRTQEKNAAITVKGARANNLKDIDIAFPLGGLVCVSGVSGSGKSSLVNEVLLKGLKRELLGSKDRPGDHDRITGTGKIERIIEVDQSPIGRTPRSNPATYTGIFDEIRKLFSMVPESQIRGYQPGRFSFNVKGGRCEECQGQGVRRIEMHFLPDVYVTCQACGGTRYNQQTLEIMYRGRTISDVLHMTVEQARDFFEAHPKVHRMLTCLADVGLDYVQLGQSSTTLSGGEAQRVKLASELGGTRLARTLYVLDEPTTGLHFADVQKLLSVLQRLVDQEHTVVVIEHNLDVLKCADWIIDLGPEGGDRGGTVLCSGTPEQVAECDRSHTGTFMKQILGGSRRKKSGTSRKKSTSSKRKKPGRSVTTTS